MQNSPQPVNPRVIRIAICVFLLMTFTRRGVLAQQSTSSIQISRVGAPCLVVSDMDRAVAFYSQVLSFEKVSDVEVFGDDYEHLEGLFGIRMRVARLQLGDDSIELKEFLTPQGRPMPAESRSNDRWFQHIAIIVSDRIERGILLRSNSKKFRPKGLQAGHVA